MHFEFATATRIVFGPVELLMRGGTLRKPGGKSSLAEDGYRILLLGVTPKKASDVMLGMVVQQ